MLSILNDSGRIKDHRPGPLFTFPFCFFFFSCILIFLFFQYWGWMWLAAVEINLFLTPLHHKEYHWSSWLTPAPWACLVFYEGGLGREGVREWDDLGVFAVRENRIQSPSCFFLHMYGEGCCLPSVHGDTLLHLSSLLFCYPMGGKQYKMGACCSPTTFHRVCTLSLLHSQGLEIKNQNTGFVHSMGVEGIQEDAGLSRCSLGMSFWACPSLPSPLLSHCP